MPFIRGRYYMNPTAGRAIEAAREAEEALLELERGRQASDANEDPSSDQPMRRNVKGPIHRVEIESTAVVPAHSGRGESAFAVRIHRGAGAGPVDDDTDQFPTAFDRNAPGDQTTGAQAETHVFSDHGDLVSFLRDEFAKDLKRRS